MIRREDWETLLHCKRITAVILAMAIVCTFQCMALADDERSDEKYYLGETFSTGKDNGYADRNPIKQSDPHFGWTLGNFFVTGYTESVEDKSGEKVFLKNVGDRVTLWFNLSQNIDCLNGKKELSISEDQNGYDVGFGVDKTDFGRGTLLIKFTNYQNFSDEPTVYTDYLSAVEVGADTMIELFEEGDYEVSLDYEIKETKVNIDKILWWETEINTLPTYTNYKITFKFSIRNGNCMVYPFDLSTKAELSNSSITPNGFYLDLARSRYLNVNVRREILKEGADGLSEDTRFNRPARDGEIYSDEGIYTITVKNNYTGEETVKTIYVGDNDILKAYVTTGLSLAEIEEIIKGGATVGDDGTIILPKGEESTPETESRASEEQEDVAEDEENLPAQENEERAPGSVLYKWVAVTAVILATAGAAILAFRKKAKKEVMTDQPNDWVDMETAENDNDEIGKEDGEC